MVVMLHNTDIPDGWEREGEDPQALLSLLTRCVRGRHQYRHIRDDALTTSSVANVAGASSHNLKFAIQPTSSQNHM